mgnify:CR=1 FL=1
MKKQIFTAILIISTVLLNAQQQFNGDWLELMDSTHKEILDKFGTPDLIFPSQSYSSDYYLDGWYGERQKLYYSITDIEFIYNNNEVTFIFDNPMEFITNNNDILLNPEIDKIAMLHLCGFEFRKSTTSTKKLPYGLSFSDNLSDIFNKLGNPDEYSKDLLTYKVPVKKIALEKRGFTSISNLRWEKLDATDTITISMNDNKIRKVKIIRNHTFHYILK